MAGGQIGYKSKLYRVGIRIPNVLKMDPILLAIAKIDSGDLDSPNFTNEYIRGFSDPPEISIDIKYVSGNGPQQQLIIDSYAGLATVEAWKVEILNPITEAVVCTQDFPAYIASAGIGPLEKATLVTIPLKLQIAGAITVAF
jgi:hypothetical protein